MEFAWRQSAGTETANPASTADLSPPQHMVVWAFRRWVLGLRQNRGAHWSLVWNEFAGRFGARDGRLAMAGFVEVMRCLQQHARRRLRHHQPCCAVLSADEVSVLRLVSASQQGQRDLARCLAAWLVREEGVENLTGAAAQFADTLRTHGLLLPEIATATPPRAIAAGPRPALAAGEAVKLR